MGLMQAKARRASTPMSEISVNVGPISVPEGRIWKLITWLPRKLAGTSMLIEKSENLTLHVSVMTDVLHIIVADLSGNWDAARRERVQRKMAEFTLIKKGLDSVVAKGNPFTQQELDTLRAYTLQAQQGLSFTQRQAEEFRMLSERASREYPNQDWVKELLKVALFIFAVYAIAKFLE